MCYHVCVSKVKNVSWFLLNALLKDAKGQTFYTV